MSGSLDEGRKTGMTDEPTPTDTRPFPAHFRFFVQSRRRLSEQISNMITLTE
ncbi:MAG: hypothetical protein WAK20_09055 [Candidatus Acidiferrum sp.]